MPRPNTVQFNASEIPRAIIFGSADPALTPVAASGVEIQQGKLEGSNVATAESAVRLVGVMRQFEMLHKAISIGAEMNKKAVEEVARVGS